MSPLRNRVAPLLIAAALLLSASLPARSQGNGIVLASGGLTGVYYPVAISICRLFNANTSGPGCAVESTAGSVDNLKMLRAGKVNFAIVQSDWQSHAVKGTDVFVDSGPHAELRSVFALYPEAFTVVARADSKIRRFEDLLGKRVNIGNQGSGQRATMELLMRAYGWTRFDFSLVRDFDSKLQARALCDNEIDAIVFISGHPSGTIKSATAGCKTNLVDVSGPKIDALVKEYDYYRYASIPAGMYRGHTQDVATFGVGATLVTTSDVSDNLVESLLKVVFDNFDLFRSMHPALSGLERNEMEKDSLTAPLHDAAKSYYLARAR